MRFSIVAIFLLLGVTSFCQTITWVEKNSYLEIGDQVEVLEDSLKSYSIEEVSSTAYNLKFKQSTKKILSFGFSTSFYWIRIKIQNKTKDKLLIELAHAFIPEAELFLKDEGGKWKTIKSGYKVPLYKKPFISHNQDFPLGFGYQEIYIRFLPYLHPTPIRLWNVKSKELYASKELLVFGLYVGILLFVIVINLFLFLSFKRPYYFLYALLVFLYIMTSATVMDGYIVYVFPNIDLMYWYKVVPVLNMPVLLLYCNSFFNLKSYDKKAYYISSIACGFFLLHIILLHFFSLMPLLLINQAYALLTFILAIYIGFTVGNKGNRLGYYFAAAYFLWVILISSEAIYIQFGKPAHFFGISHVSVAIFIEVFLLALLLVKQFEWNKKEDESAKLAMSINLAQAEEKFKHEILQSQLEIQEQTFKNISQEIHDNIGQVLTLAKLNINTMPHFDSRELQDKIEDTSGLVTKAIQDLRDLSKSLNTDFVAEMGLVKSIEYELSLLNKISGVETEFIKEGTTFNLSHQNELILFRIFQEALNNIIKHSQASLVEVLLNHSPDKFLLQVTDNGKGFDAPNINLTGEKQGLGIRNMENRSRIIGASYSMVSEPGKGTTVKIELPA